MTAVYHRLIPSISSGYGFLGLMVALIIRCRAAWVAPVAVFFAAITIGGIQLPIALQMDSSLSGCCRVCWCWAYCFRRPPPPGGAAVTRM